MSVVLPAGGVACSSLLGHDSEPGVRKLWFTPFAEAGWAGLPTIDGDKVIVAGRHGTLLAFNAATGAQLWKAQIWTTGEDLFSGNVVVRNGRACLADFFGQGCADVATGRVLWSGHFDSATQGFSAMSAMDDVALYYGTDDHRVVARNVSDGTLRWATDVAPNAPYATRVYGATLRGDTLYATTVRWLNNNGFQIAGDLIALDRATGRELWRYTPSEKSGFQGSPVLAGNVAIVSDPYAHALRAIDLTTHQQVWSSAVGPDGYIDAETPAIIVGDTVFAGSTDTQVHALDVKTGAYRWRVLVDDGSLGSTAVCGRFVVAVPLAGGKLATVDRNTRRVDRPDVNGDDDLRGRVAVLGDKAFVMSAGGLYALSCDG